LSMRRLEIMKPDDRLAVFLVAIGPVRLHFA
jgi:hypothetical protein